MKRLQLFKKRCVAKDESGVTLIEASITTALMMVVLTTIYGSFSSTQHALENTGSRLRNLDEARVLIAATTKDVRTAVRLQSGTSPFLVADARTVNFYANLDTTSAPKKVLIYVDNTSELIEKVWSADIGSSAPNYTFTGSPKIRFVGRYVANSVAEPIFTFYDSAGIALGTTPLNASNLLSIRSVKVTLSVKKATTGTLNPVTMTNQVRLPNLDYDAVAG
ncbi:MAG: hypothetical protein WCO36_08390 [Actinomycetes bacterium]